jgi:hypothetical protein
MRSHEMQVASRWNWIEAMNAMSVSGTELTWLPRLGMSAFGCKADMHEKCLDVG